MNYEEKYNDLLSRIKRMADVQPDVTKASIESLFPELKESEGEEIRKEIIAILKYKYEKFPKAPRYSNVPKWIDWLEKQGEQKPAWSEEDNAMFNFIALILRNHQSDEDFTTFETTFKDCIDWFKSLKDRVRLQNGYNPYKEVVESIAKMCKNYDNMDVGSLQDFYDNVKVKCKDAKEYDSLFPQSAWKPSKEMLEALYRVIPENVMEKSEDDMLLDKLYQGLKYGKVLSEK